MNVYQALYDLLAPVSAKMDVPIPIIFSYENAPRPPKPYASIRVDTTAISQHEIYFPVLETGFQEFGGWRRATVEVQVFGRNAGQSARRFALSLKSPSSVDNQVRLNVSVGQRLFLSETPELMNQSQFEERGIYQFEFYYSEQMDDEVGLIERVEILGKDGPSIWDEKQSLWDDELSIWDERTHCIIVVEAFPPHTPEHPAPGAK